MFLIEQKHNRKFYRNYKTIDSKKFRKKLENDLMKFNIKNIEFQTFHNILVSVLNDFQCPLKTKASEIFQRYAKSCYEKIPPEESFLETQNRIFKSCI